jgi:hypothetical protein
MLRSLLTTAAADNLKVKVCHRGFTTGDAGVNAIRLVGADNADIDIEYYGAASTAVIEFHTTPCTNVNVRGNVYNHDTGLAKTIVDTVTGSTWTADFFEGKGGSHVSGGSAQALAADDVGAVAGLHAVPTGDATTNANIRDVVGNKTDAAQATVGTTRSIMAYVKALMGFHAAGTTDAATNVYARDVVGNKTDAAVQTVAADKSLVAYTKGVLTDTVALKTRVRNLARKIETDCATNWVTGSSPATLFTVTGDVLVRVVGTVQTKITSASNDGTLEVGVAGATAALLAQTIADNTNFAAGAVWVDTSPTIACEPATNAAWFLIAGGANIILTIATNSMTAGAATLYCEWIPLSADGNVVAA